MEVWRTCSLGHKLSTNCAIFYFYISLENYTIGPNLLPENEVGIQPLEERVNPQNFIIIAQLANKGICQIFRYEVSLI